MDRKTVKPATDQIKNPEKGPRSRGHPISEVLPTHSSDSSGLAHSQSVSRSDRYHTVIDRSGKQSAPECRRAFCCHIPEPEWNGCKAIKNNKYKQGKAKRKETKKRTHRKRSHPQPKANQKNKAINTDRKTSIPTTKAENQKLYLSKRNHARLAPGYANSAENGGIAGISHRRSGF